MQGTTVSITTGSNLLAESHQSPSLEIHGTHGIIKATIKALPLAGQTMNRTYHTRLGRSTTCLHDLTLTVTLTLTLTLTLILTFHEPVSKRNPNISQRVPIPSPRNLTDTPPVRNCT